MGKIVKESEIGTSVQMDPKREKLTNHSTLEKIESPRAIESKPMRVGVTEERRIGNRIVSERNASAILLEKATEDHRQDMIEIIRSLGGTCAGGEELHTLRVAAKAAVQAIKAEHEVFKKSIDELTAPPPAPPKHPKK